MILEFIGLICLTLIAIWLFVVGSYYAYLVRIFGGRFHEKLIVAVIYLLVLTIGWFIWENLPFELVMKR